MAINGHLTHIDVLGPLVMALRPKKTRDRDGQFFTPADVARLHAELLLGDTQVEPGTSFCEPTAGAGGMLLATAEVLRQRGNDPASMTWVACDIDPVLAACTAVQAHRWGLGTNVLIGCGDALREDWIARALHERALGIRARDAASNLQILRAVQDLFTYATAA
ncbi:N-6 DNA methylase [Allosalinactinospora lopnorensis]|uniref:N-6 DNA methylase n=1 Tax=Allosalinactinospora lopnorensis TaxID=1352348 RepID=UPI0006969EA6|nr:N-6 DNA methylase [Allosalinactinospora lopnorensis]